MLSDQDIEAIILTLIITTLKVLDFHYWHNPILTIGLGFLYLILNSYFIGRIIFAEENKFVKTVLGGLFLFSYFIIVGSITYYLYRLTPRVTSAIIIFLPVIIITLYYLLSLRKPRPTFRLIKIWGAKMAQTGTTVFNFFINLKNNFFKTLLNFIESSGLIALYLILTAINFYFLFHGQTTDAISSIWQVLNQKFLFTYFLSTLTLIILVRVNRNDSINLALVCLHTFLTTATALILYPLGYGFDPFIHRAAEKVIFDTGFILPKTPYYIGQYSLIAILATIFQTTTDLVDRLLLPIGFTLFIPTTIYFVSQKILQKQSECLILALIFLAWPFSYFITTAPFGFSLLLNLVIIFTSILIVEKKISTKFLYLLLFLGLASIFIHPLSGLPICFFVALLLTIPRIKNRFARFSKIFLVIIILFSLFALPLLLGWQAKDASPDGQLIQTNDLNWQKLNSAIEPWQITLQPKFDLIIDFIHLYGNSFKWLIIIVSLVGLILIYRDKEKEEKNNWPIYPFFFLILVANYFILRIFTPFNYLINYEQAEFPTRILNLSFYFLLPLVFYVIARFFFYLGRQNLYVKFIFSLILTGAITASFYLSYPHSDVYEISHEYNVSAADFTAVRYIAAETKGDYIVLANQSVSAAALTEFGFKNYRKTAAGEIYFYPIPTSSPLYQFYLDMVYKNPDKKTMVRAMDLAGVKQGYFVLNNYWTNANKIIPRAMTEADWWEKIDDGKIWVFYFKK